MLDEAGDLKGSGREIGELERRPAHLTQSVEESSLDAWLEKYDYYRLPERSISYYNKGYLLGVLLDLQVREASRDSASLRDVFLWMNQNARKGQFFPDSEGVRQAAEVVSHADLGWFFQKYVAGTEEIPWDNFFEDGWTASGAARRCRWRIWVLWRCAISMPHPRSLQSLPAAKPNVPDWRLGTTFWRSTATRQDRISSSDWLNCVPEIRFICVCGKSGSRRKVASGM